MRLLFAVQRYGAEVLGGGERACRDYATRLAARGHDVEVVTSCAKSYVDWADVYPEGDEQDGAVTVHRFSVRAPRDHRFFGPLHERVVWGRPPPAYHVQRLWHQMQGPDLPALPGWLREHAARFDVVVFFTYLYPHTGDGLAAVAGVVPTVLHPLAHDEPPFALAVFDPIFQLADAFAYLAEEEQTLVERRFGLQRASIITGVGIDLDALDRDAGDDATFRNHIDIGERPYLLYVGRIDASKGALELVDAYRAYRERHPDAPLLVMLGELISELTPTEGVVVTGAMDEGMKNAALAGCLALVQPSYFESFSIVLCEAWAHRRPAIVQGRCEVLRGQARRSGGAIPYVGYGELEGAIELLAGDRALGEELGAAGRAYVERRYDWSDLLDRYEGFLAHVRDDWQRRSPGRGLQPPAL